jgi:predicted transglutaminase-like cysteine proteinase
MANNKNKAKTIFLGAMLLAVAPIAAHPAPFLVPKPNAAAMAISIGSRVLNYLPQPISLFAGMSMASIRATFPVSTPDRLASAPAPQVSNKQPVVEVALRPADLSAVRPQLQPAPSTALPNGAAFDTVAIPFKRLAALKRLAPALEEMQNGTAIACKGKACNAAFAAIQPIAISSTQGSLRDKLNTVNAVVNGAIRYRTDQETYKVADYWATPSETLAMQQGDCEDFAILKMAALRAEGIDPSKMSIVVLFDQKRRFYHAVLSVEVGGRYFILDNMRNQVLEDTQLPDYQPLYSIRDGKGFLHGSRRKDQNVALATSLEKIAPGEGVSSGL